MDKDNTRDNNINPYFSNYKIYNSNERVSSNEKKQDYEDDVTNLKKNIQLSDLENKADYNE